MRRGELVFGLLATPDGRGTTLTDKYRNLSIAWSRYGYRDAIVEGESVDAILDVQDELKGMVARAGKTGRGLGGPGMDSEQEQEQECAMRGANASTCAPLFS